MVIKRQPWRPQSADITNWHDRRENGESITSIAKLYRVCPETILRYTPGIPVKQPYKATNTDIEEWRARRDKGETAESIAIDYDVAPSTVLNRIGRDPTKNQKGPAPTYNRAAILKMLDEGVPHALIAQALGCSRGLPAKVKHDMRKKQGLPCQKQNHPRRKPERQDHGASAT